MSVPDGYPAATRGDQVGGRRGQAKPHGRKSRTACDQVSDEQPLPVASHDGIDVRVGSKAASCYGHRVSASGSWPTDQEAARIDRATVS